MTSQQQSPPMAPVVAPVVPPVVPQARPTTRTGGLRGLRAPLLVAGGIGLAVSYIAWQDPNVPGHYPGCPLKALTGLDCPLCGGLRSVHDLAHGDLLGALNQNLFAVLAYPVLILMWLGWARRSWVGGTKSSQRKAGARDYLRRNGGYLVLLALLLFTVVRNLPFVPYLRSGLG